MTIHYFNDLDVYFHMRNHYNKLKSVKSTIDVSSKGFVKSASQSEKSFRICNCEERHTNNCCIPNYSHPVKKHCNISSSGTCVRSASLPPRPTTRRHPYEMPFKEQCKPRSQSVIPTSKKENPFLSRNQKVKSKKKPTVRKVDKKSILEAGTNSEPKNTDILPEIIRDSSRSDSSQESKILTTSDGESKSTKSRSEEQEYLQFLLRITEDIIINNYFTNDDIEMVFQNHIEANRDRLNMGKMEAHLGKLSTELGICSKNDGEYLVQENLKEVLPPNSMVHFNSETGRNCECSTKRTIDIAERYINENIDFGNTINSDEIISNKRSLGRVTECTEPTNSVDTMCNASTKYTSVTTVSSFGYVDILPCFENTDIGNTERTQKLVSESYNQEISDNPSKEDNNLSEKEKIGCLEEAIIFEKLAIYDDHETNNIMAESENPNKAKDVVAYQEPNREGTNELSEKKEIFTKQVQTSITDFRIGTVSSKDAETQIMFPMDREVKIKFKNKHTQMTVHQADKECNTTKTANEWSVIDKNYILIQAPVYIHKTVLDSNEKLLVLDQDITKEDKFPIKDECGEPSSDRNLHDRSFRISNYTLNPNPDTSDIRNNGFSKLLNSDYDLTPQRDTEKYHNLLVDASISVASIDSDKISKKNQNNLLLSDEYQLHSTLYEKNRSDFESVVGANQINSNYYFSDNVVSQNGPYGSRDFSLPVQMNKEIELSSFFTGDLRERETSEDSTAKFNLPLTDYEIPQTRSNLRVDTGKRNRDLLTTLVGESGEIDVDHSMSDSNSHSISETYGKERSIGQRTSGENLSLKIQVID